MMNSTVMKDMNVMYNLILMMSIMMMFKSMVVAHADNSMNMNTLVTPHHIVPEWYFLAYYNMLKMVPSKEAGMMVFMSTMVQEMMYNTVMMIYSKMINILLGSLLTTMFMTSISSTMVLMTMMMMPLNI